MALSRQLHRHEATYLRLLGSQLSTARRGSEERSFWIERIAVYTGELNLGGVRLNDVAAELPITAGTLRRWRRRETESATRPARLPRGDEALPLVSYQSTESLMPTAPGDKRLEEKLIEPLQHHPERFTVREESPGTHEQTRLRSQLVVLALSGPTHEGQRYELEMSVLRGLVTSYGHQLVEKAGINVTELAHEANQLWPAPAVLHLATHVNEVGVWMVDGKTDRPIRWEMLIDQLERLLTLPALVVFSCCYSSKAADTVSRRWPETLAIGCDGRVPDDTARIWAETFYDHWFRHLATTSPAHSVARAVDIANTRIASHHPSARWRYRHYPEVLSVDGQDTNRTRNEMRDPRNPG